MRDYNLSGYDIFDINYLVSHKNFNSIRSLYYSDSIWRLFRSICTFLLTIISYVLFKNFGVSKLPKVKYAFFGATSNNIRALQPVMRNLQNAFLYKKEILPYGLTALYSLRYVLVIISLYKKNNGYIKKSIASDFSSYCLACAYITIGKLILYKVEPKVSIFANDHGYPYRALFRIAQNNGIKTVYMQHASVSENFPPLEYDYAFLDGMESFEKYLKDKTCKAKVFLSGPSRFDLKRQVNKDVQYSNDIKKVGIAINEFDNKDKVIELIYQLRSIGNFEYSIRPHPRQNQYTWQKISKKLGCKFSFANKEDPLTFISTKDIFIAGESSFHLDVAIMGKYSFYYNFTNSATFDNYGYLKNKLVMDITEIAICKIADLLNSNIFNDRDSLIKYYVANYKTHFWGKASEVISLTISNLTDKGQIPPFWIEKEKSGIHYFELVEKNGI